MSIEIISGDLLEAFDRGEVTVIGHCCNTKGIMGSGLAKSIKDKYPKAYTLYKSCCDSNHQEFLLGKAQCVYLEGTFKFIFNLFGQLNFGTHARQGNYGAIAISLLNMRKQVKDNSVIGFPYKMCSDRAGCDWQVILEMIEFIFSDCEVKIYRLEK